MVGEVAGFSAPVRKVVCLRECKFFELTENVIGKRAENSFDLLTGLAPSLASLFSP